MEGIANRKILVLGLGATGRSAANFCIARGASVLAADERAEDRSAGGHRHTEFRYDVSLRAISQAFAG